MADSLLSEPPGKPNVYSAVCQLCLKKTEREKKQGVSLDLDQWPEIADPCTNGLKMTYAVSSSTAATSHMWSFKLLDIDSSLIKLVTLQVINNHFWQATIAVDSREKHFHFSLTPYRKFSIYIYIYMCV